MKVCLCCWGITEKLRKKEMFIVQMTFYQKKREEIFNKKKNKMYFSLYDSIS